VKRWSELKEAFWDLADREASDQQHRLALLASTDPEMHEQLHALLAADARGEQLLHPLDGLTRFAPNPPLRVGPYEIIGVLGVGGMGEVYRARDPRLHREVAVKVLPPAWVTDPQRLARFEREARVLAALNHPNIAAIYGFEAASPEGGSPGPALILELVEGETLGECIALRSREPNNMALTAGAAPQPASVHRSSPGLETSAALLIARQIAEALDAAHKKGIVHRDLKPANVKIGPDGTVKVLDFGLATAPMDTVDADPTRNLRISTGDAQEGFIAGTAGYMSPEQACGEAVDRRADIWAFGCVLYEMLTGRALCAAGALSDAFAAASECGPDWRALPDDTPEEIRRLLIRTLARDPEQRLGDIGDARRTIDAELAQRGQPGKATQQQNNLPLQASPLVGRQSELVEAGELLRKHRCLTLTGPGGSGKTRLALQLAASAL
jgi:serine/threonine protein kinase